MNRPQLTANSSSHEIGGLLQRICTHIGVAFSANRILPLLADIQENGDQADLDQLNALAKNFGFQFREMSGSIRDLILAADETGLIAIRASGIDNVFNLGLVNSNGRGRLNLVTDQVDKRVTGRWLKQRLASVEGGHVSWLMIKPMLAYHSASNLHYQGSVKPKKLSPQKRFIGLLKPEARDIRTILIFSIVIGLLSLTTPLAVEAVVNTIAFGRYLQPLIVLCLMVLVFLGFRAALGVLTTVVAEFVQRKLFVRTVEDLAYRLTRVPLNVWKKHHGPELVNRFFDITSIQKISSKLLLETLMLGLQTIIGLSVLAFYHPFLLGYDIALLVMMTIVLWVIGRGAVFTAKQESTLKYETAAWLQELVRHPSTFKFNGGLGFAINRADELTAKYVTHRQQHFKILVKQVIFAMSMQVLAATVLLALGGYLVIQGEMTLGQLVAAELIVSVILGSFAKLGKDLESYYDLMAAVDKIGVLFDLPIEPTNKLQIARVPGAYQVSLVDLLLDDQMESPASLEFSPNGFYSIFCTDENRITHLIETLVGQATPRAGHVLLDDFRVDAIAAESLQEKISLIQDVELFEGSIEDNLRMGRENIGSHAVSDIINRIGLRKTLASLEKGLNTKVRLNGNPLTRGQAIRLVLARALIAKPAVLIVDGLLDRLSDWEKDEVLKSLEGFCQDITMIISTGQANVAARTHHCLNIDQSTWSLSKYTE